MDTRVYHIAFAPEHKQAYLHFWGCNLDCKWCECKKAIWDYMLDETMRIHSFEPRHVAAPPTKFLGLDEVVGTLEKLGARWVLFEGQEASQDLAFPAIARALHERLSSTNVLLTNALSMPDVTDIDKVCVGLKAYDEKLHIHCTGKSNKQILENFKKLAKCGKTLSAEMVYIPGCIEKDEIVRVARFIASVDANIRLQIDGYFKSGDNPWRPPTDAETEAAVMEARNYLNNVHCFKGSDARQYKVESIFPSGAEIAEILRSSFLTDETGTKV